jgi:RNA polymerase sigma-70 factor (ECF subfamily)
MSEDEAFRDLIRRVRAGDEQAAYELVRQYESAIRVAVRVRLSDRSLRRVLDSMDVCQSVFLNFFMRAASGQFELETPEHLLRLLVTMARNKLTNVALKQRAARRDQRRVEKADAGEQDLIAPGPSVSELVANRELLREFHKRLSAPERKLADLRAQGLSWPEIATRVGEDADALRMRLTRAIDRVASELRLEE